MSNILKKFKKDKKNYKELYEIELNNRKKYEKRYREKCRDYIELQKEKGLPELKMELMKISDERDFLKEDRARLFVELEDLKNDIKLGKYKKESEDVENGN